ncbi:MAG: hypothetical protein U0574_03070 [Phycisphaerales bacterium]
MSLAAATPGPAPRLSRLAVLSLILDIPFFIPIFSAGSALLGVVAWVRCRRRRDLSGRAFAGAAVVLGVLLTALFTPYWYHGLHFLATGPQEALRAGFAGDTGAFRAAFAGPGARAEDAEAAAFLDALRSRHGAFRGASIIRRGKEPEARSPVAALSYRLAFETGEVEAAVELVLKDPEDGRATLKLGAITVPDGPDRTLAYPSRSTPRSPR